jgi:hypothetical protein
MSLSFQHVIRATKVKMTSARSFSLVSKNSSTYRQQLAMELQSVGINMSNQKLQSSLPSLLLRTKQLGA